MFTTSMHIHQDHLFLEGSLIILDQIASQTIILIDHQDMVNRGEPYDYLFRNKWLIKSIRTVNFKKLNRRLNNLSLKNQVINVYIQT